MDAPYDDKPYGRSMSKDQVKPVVRVISEEWIVIMAHSGSQWVDSNAPNEIVAVRTRFGDGILRRRFAGRFVNVGIRHCTRLRPKSANFIPEIEQKRRERWASHSEL
jgi:hypothetical protein